MLSTDSTYALADCALTDDPLKLSGAVVDSNATGSISDAVFTQTNDLFDGVTAQGNDEVGTEGTEADEAVPTSPGTAEQSESGADNSSQSVPDQTASSNPCEGQTDGSNSAVQQLIETLRVANAPPGEGGNQIHLTPDLEFDPGADLVLNRGDSLTGSGTIAGGLINNGLLSPGNSPGITNVATFDQGPDGVTLIEIGGTAGAGVDPNGWDQVNVSGSATLDGTLQITLFNGFVPNLGDSFLVFTWGSVIGQFANWLGTAGIPGHADWAFKPTQTAGSLTLTVVQTPVIAGPAGSAIDGGLDTLGNVANFLDDLGEFAEDLPFVGSNLGALSGLGTAVQNAVANRLSSFPNPAQIVSTIESWDGTSFGGFTVDVKGVLAQYGTLSSEPMWWEVTLELSPAAVNRVLSDVVGGVFEAGFTSAPSVNVNGKVVLDFAFGFDSGIGGFFVDIDSLAAVATVNASGLAGFGFSFDITPTDTQSLSGSGGTVNLTASVAATPDSGILTAGRITQADLSSLNASNIGDSFNLDEGGMLHAAFPLTGTLNFAGFTFNGTYTVRLDTDDLMTEAPDLTVDVASTLVVLGQTLNGTFTLKNTGTETILEASNVNFQLGAGATRVLSVQNGAGTFVLLGTDLAGTMTMDFNLGPAIPNISMSATGLSLAFNTSAGTVPMIDGTTVNLPAGPYFRVSGNATISLTSPQASLSGDFVFEPNNADSETVVGVANLSFSFTDGTNPLLNVTDGTGAFVFRTTGIVGSLSVEAELAVPDLSVTGVFSVALNDTNAAYNQSVDVNGTTVVVNVPAGPFLRVSVTGNIGNEDETDDEAELDVLGILVSGNFTFERRQTSTGGEQVVTVAASNVSLDLGSVADDLISITNGSGAFIITNAGIAGTSTATLGTDIPGVTLGGTFTVRINDTNAAVNETVSIGGSNVVIDLPTGPFLQVSGTGVTLGFLGVTLTGNFSFEQHTAQSGTQLITVIASNVSFNFGTNLVTLSNGSGAFFITESGIAGQGQITAAVNAFGGSFSHTFQWSFNTMGTAIDEVVGNPTAVELPAGPFNTIDSGPTPVAINIPIGSYTQSLSGRFILTMHDPNAPTIALIASTSGGVNGSANSVATLNPPGDNNAVRIRTTSNATAGNLNGSVFRYVDEPTITTATAQVQWDAAGKVLTVRVNAANTTANAVVSAINAASTPWTALLETPDNGTLGNTGAGTISWPVVTVGVSSLSATVGFGPLNLQVSNGSGALVIFSTGIAGEVRVDSVTLNGAGVLSVDALNLAVRFNNTGHDVGNPDPIVVAINDNPADDVSLQFAGPYYHQFFSVAGTAEISGLAGAVTLGGNFVFERAQLDTNNDTVLEDLLKIGVTDLRFDLKAGSFTVASFDNGTGAFIIKSTGIAGIAQLDFEAGVIGISGTIGLELNTTGVAVTNASVPTPNGPSTLNLAAGNYVRVEVDGHIHVGSISVPFDFIVQISGGTVQFLRASDSEMLVTIDSSGGITLGTPLSSLTNFDFATAGPFEFVSLLRQALVWIDSFRDADLFDVEIPFTGGTTLGEAFDWSQVFLDLIYSKMVSVELQSAFLALQTDTVKSGSLSTALFKLQFNDDTPIQVNVAPLVAVAYSNADNNLNELVNAFNNAFADAGIDDRVVARIHKFKDQIPTDSDYADRFKDDVFVIALTDAEIANGTTLNLVDLDADIAALGFGPSDGNYGDAGDDDPATLTVEQVGVLTNRFDTRGFIEQLADLLNDGTDDDDGPVDYQPEQQVYTYTVDTGMIDDLFPADLFTYDTEDLFGMPELPFNWDLDLGPIASASLSGALQFSVEVGFTLTLGFDLGAREVPRLLSTSTVPVPANGRITQNALFMLYLNDESAPIPLMLPKTDLVTPLNNSIDDLADDLNRVFHEYFYNGPLVTVPTRLDQLIVAQKAGSGLAISALQEPDSDSNGVPDAGKDYNGDGNTDQWLGLINRLVAISAQNDTFATEMGFGNEAVDIVGVPHFISLSTSTMKGLFIEDASLSAALSITTVFDTPGNPNDPDGIQGSLRFGFVEISTNNGSFGTVEYDGTTSNPLTVSLSLEDQTTGESRFYLSELFNGTEDSNIGNMVLDLNFGGSLLARLDQISIGGLGFNFPLGANPQVSAWIPDINDLDFNPNPYDGNNTGIFLTYPNLGDLQNFQSLSFTQIIQAINVIADNLSQLSAFSFLNEPLPFVNMSVNDMIDYASKFAELIDSVAAGGAQSSLQDTLAELESQIEILFDLSPDILSIFLDDGGLSGLSGFTLGGVNGSTHSSVTLNPAGANNAVQIRTTALGAAADHNGSLIRYIADAAITGTNAVAVWNDTARVLTVRVNSGRTTATAIVTAINGAGSPFTALLDTAGTTGDPGNTGAGAVTTSAFVTTGGVNGSFHSTATLMPGGDNNNFTLTTTNLGTAASYNGTTIRMFGDSAVTGNTAQVSWDQSNPSQKLLTIKINPGVTTANTIINAINTAGIPWNAALAPPDNATATNTGNGPITTTALKFSFLFETAFADSIPFQLDLQELLSSVAGDNAILQAFLDLATTLVQISGSGNLTVSAGAKLTLDFGLDLSNPSSVKPFFYDSTGVELTAKVLGTNIDIEAALGGVFGIFIKDGTITLDHDGDPETDAGHDDPATPGPDHDKGAIFRLGLKDNNGDGRHYFTEDWFNSDSIDLRLEGGVSAQLPIFAPFEGTPLSGEADTNNDGFPDNYLVVEIPDVVRLFLSEAVNTEATGASKVVKFGGLHNDLDITSSLYTNYDILFLDTLSGNTANASFNTTTNTLTVNIDAGMTTAQVARDHIQSATGGGGTFAATELTNDDDGDPDTTGNDGTGKLEKLFLATPDFSQLFAGLDLCDVISANIGTILDGLDELLGSIEDGLNEIVYNTELPLIGDGLQGAANFISDFRNGLLQQLRDEVEAAGGNGLTAMENAVKKALWNSLGPGGLDLLVDYDTGEELDLEAGFSQLDVTLDCEPGGAGLLVKVRLKEELALLDTSQNPIDFEIGVPGFGLAVEGNVSLSIGFDLKFGFGFNTEDGFFFDTSSPADDPELVIEFRAEIPGLHASGELLFLQLDVMDDAEDPSLFRGFFEVDLKDPDDNGRLTFAEIFSSGTEFEDILHAVLGAEAHLNLDLAASFGGNTAFPRVLASFHLDWMFDTDNGAGDPQISFDEVYLDLGTFISDFLGPVLAEIRKITEPIQPIIDLVTARIPILSDLAGETITLLTLAEIFGLLEPTTVDFIEDVLKIIELINSLEGIGEGTILIPFGGFSLLADENGERRNIAPLQAAVARSFDEIANAAQNYDDPGASSSFSSASAGFVSDAGALSNFSIPIWDNPAELFNLFIGEPVRLVEWRMPTFKFEFTYTQKIPIYPPLYAQFGGSIGATIDVGFGYDTFGIQKFIASEDKNFLDILDGFYVIDFDANGNERPELTLTGEIFAGASINLLIVEVGVKGGVTVTFEFDLNDVNDDGKVRVSEIIANAQQDPRCIFDIHGEISLFLEAFLKVDLFFFSIEKTWRFADITLLEFDITCPMPVLADVIGADLYLNIGSRAADRDEIDTNDNSERFIVKHTGGAAGNETVEVEWGNFKQTFTFTGNLIIEDAGQGDDYIDLRGVLSRVEVHGGEGNDTIFLSDAANSIADGDGGNDTITASTKAGATGVVIYGGPGNDTLIGGPVAITIYGDSRLDFGNPVPITGGTGKDIITGSPEEDFLYGEAGDDEITGGDGDDLIEGGNGNDTVDGNAGNDFILGGAGADYLRGSRGDNLIDGGEDDDQIFGSSGIDILIGGNDDDKMFAHGGVDLMVGDLVGTINNIAFSHANRTALLGHVAAIPVSGITLKGINGAGNDFMVGGGNVDVIFGGDGDDFLYGGNFMEKGSTEVIEEDHNDFFDGGRGNDTIFGDDSMGRTGDRNTGIEIKSSIWFDGNLNGLRDGDEMGFGGVTVWLYRQTDSQLIATEETEVDGTFRFTGLDPTDYYLEFSIPTGMNFVGLNSGGATDPEGASDDNDADQVGAIGRTDQFNVTYGETESAVAAGYTGPAKVSVTDQSVTEGNGGATNVTFVVTLSHLQGAPVEIEYRTAAGTATSNSGDYQHVPNTILTFAPGETSKAITLVVFGETKYEQHEQFELVIVRAERMDPNSAVALDVSDSQLLVTIINDDPIPTISIRDYQQVGFDHDDDPLTPLQFVENKTMRFIVTLSNPSQQTVTVQWRTDQAYTFQAGHDDEAATPSGFPGADFMMNNGTLTFLPGVTTAYFEVTINHDLLDEPDEHFFVDLFNPVRAEINDGRAYGIIADDDIPVSVYIVPLMPAPGQPFTTQVTEGSGLVWADFQVKLSTVSAKQVSVTWGTTPGTAVESVFSGGTDDVDYWLMPNEFTPDSVETLVFEPGDTIIQVRVYIFGDNDVEGQMDPDNAAQMIETFFVNILSAENADIARDPLLGQSNHNTVKIVDDDNLAVPDAGPWSVYFDSLVYTHQEPDSADNTAFITLRRTPGSSEPVAVFYTTNGSATAGSDYTQVFRHIVYFNGDDTFATVPIQIKHDNVVEGTETVLLSLRNPTGGKVRASPDTAVLRILDSDRPDVVFVSTDVAFTEGTAGTPITRTFTVQLRYAGTNTVLAVADQQSTITVDFRTIDLTARQPGDYLEEIGTLTFAPNEVSKIISVDVVRDSIPELSETFAIQLSNPSGANLVEHEDAAIVTLNDDDLTPIMLRVFFDNNGNGFKDINENTIKDVGVTFTYLSGGTPIPVAGVYTFDAGLNDYFYRANVLLGQVTATVDGSSVTSPYKDLSLAIIFFGTGSYEATTNNETQTAQFKGIVGLPAFADVGYDNTFTLSLPEDTDDVGRGGTDDTIFGGPGNDLIDAGAGDDHVVGGHWMTATDNNAPINVNNPDPAPYNAVLTVTTRADDPTLHPIFDDGPIFGVNTTSPDAGINANGSISGQIWFDANGNREQDLVAGEVFNQYVLVNLYDCNGNPVNSLMTNTGSYTFTGLYITSIDSEYVVEFVLPHDFDFVSFEVNPETTDQDVIVGGRTQMIVLNGGTLTATNVDAGIKGSNVARQQVTGGFRFSEPSYSVSESGEDGFVTIEILRTNSFLPRAVVVKTVLGGSAVANTNYTPVTVLLFFDVGETIKSFDIPILDTDLIEICTEPLTIHLELRDVTGRPYDTAVVYIGGDTFGGIPDDDNIQGGEDWDIIIGDSGNIPGPTVIDPTAPYNSNYLLITYSGGPGKDIILGGGGPDFINGQLFNDDIAGNLGADIIEAGLGDDEVLADFEDDVINGDFGFDTVVSRRNVATLELKGTIVLATLEHFNSAGSSLSTFTLNNFEFAQLYGGPTANVFDIETWDGAAIISGAGGTDTLLVTNSTDMILKNASILEGFVFQFIYGFFKDSSLSLANGNTYHLGGLEKVQITLTGAGANVVDAADYSRPVTFSTLGGNDTFIGSSADDTFKFLADASLGTNTLTGMGGRDTIDLTGTLAGVTVDLNLHSSQPVNGNLSLILTDDIENVTGGSGADFLYGNGLRNVLRGGPGNDWLQGRGGNETYAYDADSVTPEHDTIVEDAGGGNDTLDFSSSLAAAVNVNISITGAQNVTATLTLTIQNSIGGEAEFESIIGGAQADTIRGNAFNNTLRGGLGNDVLDGKSGDDVLDGGPGNDDLDGGEGGEVIGDTINETADTNFILTNTSLVRTNGEVDTLDNIEVANLTGGASPNTFTLTGWTGSGRIDGADDPDMPALDTVIVAANANFTLTDSQLLISTNSGAITLAFYFDPLPAPQNLPTIDIVLLTDGPGNHTLDASGFTGDTTLQGGEGDDVLIGGAGTDLLLGGIGNDKLTGNRGNDLINGGAGTDTLIEDLSGASWNVEFVIQNNLLVIVQVDPNPAPPDQTITEGDFLTSIEAANITGSPQDDTFDVSGWSAGALTVNGQGESSGDSVQSVAPGAGTLTLTNTGITFTDGSGTSAATLTFSSIETVWLYGSDGDDVLDASAYSGAAALIGGGGNDTLKSGPGTNLLNGGDGDDLFSFSPDTGVDFDFVIGGDGIDTLDYSAFSAPVTINLASVGVVLNAVAGDKQLFLTSDPGPAVEEIENLIGGGAADTLTGNALNNRLTGGGGADIISGGTGSDTLVETADTNFTLTNASLTDGGGTVDTLASLERAELTGGAGANTFDASTFTGATILDGRGGGDLLVGGTSSDLLIGGAGNDTMRGGLGFDTYEFDVDEALGEDIVDEAPGAGTDFLDFRPTTTVGVSVDIGRTTQQDVHVTNLKLTLTSATAIDLVAGGDGNDVLIGNTLGNFFLAGRGSDSVTGGGGTDLVFESADGDFTLVSTAATTAALTIVTDSGTEQDQWTDIEGASLTGGDGNNILDASLFTGGAIELQGGDGNDILIGGYGDDQLDGGNGNDSLFGGAGSDTLEGGNGEDTLNGSGAIDTSIAPDGNDTLIGGNESDHYVFDLSFHQGSDSIRELDGGGANDALLGIGISGVVVNLYSIAPQPITVNSVVMLTLTFIYPLPADLGEIELSF